MLNERAFARGMNPGVIIFSYPRVFCRGEQQQTATRVPSLDWPSDLFSRPVAGDTRGCQADLIREVLTDQALRVLSVSPSSAPPHRSPR